MAPRHGDVKCTLGVPLLTCFFGAPAARLGGGVLFQRLPALRSRYRKLRAADEALHGEFVGMTFEVTDFWIDLFIVRLTATPEIGTDLQKGYEPLGREDPPPPWCTFRRSCSASECHFG